MREDEEKSGCGCLAGITAFGIGIAIIMMQEDVNPFSFIMGIGLAAFLACLVANNLD